MSRFDAFIAEIRSAQKFAAAAEQNPTLWLGHLTEMERAFEFFSQSGEALAIETSDRLAVIFDDTAADLKQRLLAVVSVMQDACDIVRHRLPKVN
jgi:hypothetical protein